MFFSAAPLQLFIMPPANDPTSLCSAEKRVSRKTERLRALSLQAEPTDGTSRKKMQGYTRDANVRPSVRPHAVSRSERLLARLLLATASQMFDNFCL